VNGTNTQEFANPSRVTNYWAIEENLINKGDQTGNTVRNNFIEVYFDKQTGILNKLIHIESFTNPEILLTINWQLTSSNVWSIQSTMFW
jgi:hypothetical protein